MITLARYLELYHEESEALRRDINTMLGRGDLTEAQALLVAWDGRVDALWAQVETPA